MADDPQSTPDMSDHADPPSAAKEDAETTRARRELKQTSISEKAGHAAAEGMQLSQDDKSASEDDAPAHRAARRLTPPVALAAANPDVLKEQLSSPKKKRAHDELDENRDVSEAPLEEGAASNGSNTAGGAPAVQSRTNRSEPEKKRPRDRQASASAVQGGKEEVEPLSASASPRSSMEQASESKAPTAATTKPEPPKQTSASAFASSGFAKLASSSASPFGSFGGAGKPSLFGSASAAAAPSLGGVLGGSKPAAPSAAPKLSFGSATAATSPFGGLNGQSGGSVFRSSPFASAFGGSALPGARLNFGTPGEVLKSDKPAKPFGAPESDAEDSSSGDEGDEDEEGKGAEESEEDGDKEEGADKADLKLAGDDKKKPKLQKIVVDDGEGQEVTLFSVRAKMYLMEKGVGWKERGAGMLKVNVPKSTVELDEQGVADASSFDASVLEDGEESTHVRLIMRQDHTLRVILNTVILPAMKFQVTNRLKTSTVLFTAFEGAEVRQVQMKLSEANATAFSQLVEMLKKRLADV